MSDQAESSQRPPPMTPPPPPSPSVPGDSCSEAILWVASDEDSSSTSHTHLVSLWLSNYTGLPQFEAEEEPLVDVPTLRNLDLESSLLDLVDWNTTSIAVTQAPVVTQPLWVQLHAPSEGEVGDLSLALGIQSPKASILPLALRSQDPEAFDSPLPLGIQPPPASSVTVAPQASLSPLALGLPASFGIHPPQAPISPLALGIQSSQISFGIQSVASSFSSLTPIPCTLPIAPPLWNLQPIPSTLPTAPPLWNLPSIPCALPMAPPLWNLPSPPCTLPVAPPLWNFLPSPSPVPERRSWSEFSSTPPPARRQFLLPHSASASVSSPSSHPSHQPHGHFFPAANTGYQQQVPVAHAPVTICTRSANASFSTGFVPSSRPPGSQGMAPHGSLTPNLANEPRISSGQDTKLPIPRRPRFLLPPTVATTTTAPLPLLASFGSSGRNMPSWNARRDVPVGDHEQVQTGESSRPRKRSKFALNLSNSEASHSRYDATKIVPITREEFALDFALNTNGKARALPGTATDSHSLFSRYKREKIKQRMKILQELVPNGDKADMAILLEQTHTYIRFLEQQIKVYFFAS